MPKPRTLQQNRAIHSLLNSKAIDADLKAEMVTRITKGRTSHTSEMYFSEANALITELGGDALDASRRTQQAHRQKAGVLQMMTADQRTLLEDLASKRWGAEWATPCANLCRRMLNGRPIPRTTKDANKVIEAIKAMNARDARNTKEAA
jgi:hypothetical protein